MANYVFSIHQVWFNHFFEMILVGLNRVFLYKQDFSFYDGYRVTFP